MRVAVPPSLRIVAGLLLVVLLGVAGCEVLRWRNSGSPEAILKRADDKSWLNDWIGAEPLYRQAELQFAQKHLLSKALYARVSEVPAHSESSITVPAQIAFLTDDLKLPEAKDSETRLRILTVLGMLDVNYDAGMARKTWSEVENLAIKQHHYLLASRAIGEQGIAAFLLGDIATAKKNVLKAWMVSKVADPAARIRYASMYGTGLVELHKYNEALGPLNEAIKIANKTPGAAYPTIAITAKVQSLSGLGRNREALALADEEMLRVSTYRLGGHFYEIYQTRAGVYERMGQWDHAISDYKTAAVYGKQMSYWRGVTQVDGLLASAYLHEGELNLALMTVDEAIQSNEKIPEELYFVPRNLALKAEILARLGDTRSSNQFYEKSADTLDALLSKAPTPNVERQLISDLSKVYSGYFASLGNQGRVADAFRVIERARGRIEAQSMSRHEIVSPHAPSPADQRLTELNVSLINTDDSSSRSRLLDAIYETEQQLPDGPPVAERTPTPVGLKQLQDDLRPSELFLEYVFDDPQSYVLAVTHESVRRYPLASKEQLESQITQYRSVILNRGTDPGTAQELFNELLGGIPEVGAKQTLIVVPDGKLNLLPLTTLVNNGQYLLASHLVTVVPSGTVLHILRHHTSPVVGQERPYVGVAAWTTSPRSHTLFANIVRSVSGPERKEFIALPESRHEVEAIADDLPKPNSVLLGSNATETNFKNLPLNQYVVIHLALHGYVDPEYSDRSALVFAPQRDPTDDSLLQIREIRNLHLNASLVTLSACNTGLGPIGESGVANIVNSFIEAGSQTVVSTLWELEDHATTHLMTVFYDRLGHQEDKGEALRKAQLEMLNAGSPPYYWAAFELVGEPHGSLFSNAKSDPPSRNSR